MVESTRPNAVPAATTGFFGHPRGLATLFFTEFWERFSYYGMRSLLILFMTAAGVKGGLGFSAAKAGAIYGLYTMFVYLLSLPGGWIADQLLGQRRAVFVGGVIIACGHFSMAFEGLTPFYLGLFLITIGTGLLKPNISTMVGELYPEGGARRDAGFSVFYMGINSGGFIAPFVCGALGQGINWHYGFVAAGVGMVLGLVQYVAGGKHLGSIGLAANAGDDPAMRRRASLSLVVFGVVALGVVAAMASGALPVTPQQLAGSAFFVVVGLAVVFFLYQFLAGGLVGDERKRVLVIAVLFAFSFLFWAGFEQAGSSLNLFADRLTDRVIGGWTMPASFLQSVNSMFIILLAPVFSWLWLRLASRQPSAPMKFALGLIGLGAGFAVMVWASLRTAGGTKQVLPTWLITTYLLHTIGELCLSPVGLSTVTKLAPHRKVGQMMGVWFMSLALGNLLAGLIGGRFETLPLPRLFGMVCVVTVGAGLVLALFSRPVHKLMAGAE
jgi:POT family proton-dependent oligopeptide transporter